jgi:hypothetical protein
LIGEKEFATNVRDFYIQELIVEYGCNQEKEEAHTCQLRALNATKQPDIS